jgi:N-acetyl-gamma-glutamyl-phosphate reductase
MADARWRLGVVGASGYAGAELLRLAASHPSFHVVVATGDSQAGQPIASLYPSLAAAYGAEVFAEYTSSLFADHGVDIAVLALPHGASQALVPTLLESTRFVVDVAADFRLKDAALYPQWYGEPHACPELLPRFAYGLPELFRDEVKGASAIATPGCYPTAASLAIAPLVRLGLIETTGVIVDAACGVSGAGRALKHTSHFCTVDEDFTAYGLIDHRHTPEIEQNTGAQVLFTPHLAPMNRGILATCYARPAAPDVSTASVMEALTDFYANEPFVVVSDRSPSTKATLGSNCAHLTARVDERTGTVVVLSAIDNLVKGTAGASIQCMNILTGLPETTGLPIVGVYP